MSATRLRAAAAICVSVLTASAAYAALAGTEPAPLGGEQFLTLLLPGALIGLMLVAYVLMPLWQLFTARANSRLGFLLVAGTIWAPVAFALFAPGASAGRGALNDALPLLVSGWVLIAAFGLLAEKRDRGAARATEYDDRPAVAAPPGRAASRLDLAPAAGPRPGSGTAGG